MLRNTKPADEPGGVTAVTRALALMECFEVGEHSLTLAELSRRSNMHKTTVLRLARTLALSNYMVQTEDGQWRLGAAAGGRGARGRAAGGGGGGGEPTLH